MDTKDLSSVLPLIKTKKEAQQFLEEFFSDKERDVFDGRWRAALELTKTEMNDVSQEEVARRAQCAVGVVGRMSRTLRRTKNKNGLW